MCYCVASPDLFISEFLYCFPISVIIKTTRIVWTQLIVTWGLKYIYEGFLIWIIPSTYQSHESVIWACITSFVHICLTWCFIAYRCVPVLTTQFLIYAYLIRIYQYTRVCLCTPLGTILRTRWVDFWQPWTCMSKFQNLDRSRFLSWRPAY